MSLDDGRKCPKNLKAEFSFGVGGIEGNYIEAVLKIELKLIFF